MCLFNYAIACLQKNTFSIKFCKVIKLESKTLNLYINIELIKRAKKDCIDKDISLSALVSRLLLEYLDKK